MHTDFMGTEELNRLCYDFVSLKRRYGIDSKLAVMNDVPGHPISLPSVLAGSGVNYLMTGANLFLVGGTSLAPGRVPFYWEGPDGKRVLTWVSQSSHGGYTEALADFFLDPYSHDPYGTKTLYEILNPNKAKPPDMELMEEGIATLNKRYIDAGYAYDAVMTIWGHDFIEPRNVSNLERAVGLWNHSHGTPVLKIATPPEFFHYIEQKYANRIPTYRGEWSGLWSEAKTHSPQISALARYAHDYGPAAEALWSTIALKRRIPFPAGNIATIFDLMFTYDEHSGAGNTGWPQLNTREKLEEQNREYVHYMKQAQQEIRYLFDEGIDVLAEPTTPIIPKPLRAVHAFPLVVYNPVSWSRTDVVVLDPPQGGTWVTTIRKPGSSRPIPFDVDENGSVIFVAEEVPSLGYQTYLIEVAPGQPKSPWREVAGSLLAEGKYFKLRMGRDGSVESILERSTERELVNWKGQLPFNSLLRVQGSEPAPLPLPVEPEIHVKHGTALLRIEVTRARSAFPFSQITLYDSIPRIDIRNEIDGSRLPFATSWTGQNSYFFSYPFDLDPQTLVVMPEGHKGFLKLPEDYLPGARRDSVTSQHVVCLADAKGAVTLAHRQSFHFVFPGYLKVRASAGGKKEEMPAMLTGSWPLPEATLYAKALRQASQSDTYDLGTINMATVEPGLGTRYRFDYAIGSLPAFDAAKAARFGWEHNLPLWSRYVMVPPERTSESIFRLDQPNVLIVAVKPEASTSGPTSSPVVSQGSRRLIVRLQEIAGRAETTVRITSPLVVKAADTMSLTEETLLQTSLPVNRVSLRLKAYETVTLRLLLDGEHEN